MNPYAIAGLAKVATGYMSGREARKRQTLEDRLAQQDRDFENFDRDWKMAQVTGDETPLTKYPFYQRGMLQHALEESRAKQFNTPVEAAANWGTDFAPAVRPGMTEAQKSEAYSRLMQDQTIPSGPVMTPFGMSGLQTPEQIIKGKRPMSETQMINARNEATLTAKDKLAAADAESKRYLQALKDIPDLLLRVGEGKVPQVSAKAAVDMLNKQLPPDKQIEVDWNTNTMLGATTEAGIAKTESETGENKAQTREIETRTQLLNKQVKWFDRTQQSKMDQLQADVTSKIMNAYTNRQRAYTYAEATSKQYDPIVQQALARAKAIVNSGKMPNAITATGISKLRDDYFWLKEQSNWGDDEWKQFISAGSKGKVAPGDVTAEQIATAKFMAGRSLLTVEREAKGIGLNLVTGQLSPSGTPGGTGGGGKNYGLKPAVLNKAISVIVGDKQNKVPASQTAPGLRTYLRNNGVPESQIEAATVELMNKYYHKKG